MAITEVKSSAKSKRMEEAEKFSSGESVDEHAHREDIPFECCGTSEGAMIWCVSTDISGIVLASLVWLMILFSAFVCIMIMRFEKNGNYNIYNGYAILFLIFMSLWSHGATMLGDPGAVPSNARPLAKDVENGEPPPVCDRGKCGYTYKPPGSHHDKNSNRCISRMDHFCPWTNNAVGAKNQKNFFLFLIYTFLASMYLYVLLGINLIHCKSLSCDSTNTAAIYVVRTEVVILLFGVIFTFSMIVNQAYNLASGLTHIDR